MKDFAKIKTTIWSSEKFKKLTNDQKLFYLYCHSNNRVNSCGCYYSPIGYMMVDLRLSQTDIEASIKACEDNKLIRYNANEDFLLIEAFFTVNFPNNPKHALKIVSDIEAIPYREFKSACALDLKRFLTDSGWKIEEKLLYRIDTLSIPKHHLDIDVDVDIDVDNSIGEIPKKNKNHDQNTREIFELTEIEKPKIDWDLIFDNWWNDYPDFGPDGARGSAFKGSKKTARQEFIKTAKKEKNHETFINEFKQGLGRYRIFLEQIGSQQGKHASTWINCRGWEDDYSVSGKTTMGNRGRAPNDLNQAVSTVLDGNQRREAEKSQRLENLGFDADTLDL